MHKSLLIIATVIQIVLADTLLRSLNNGDKRAMPQDTLLRSLKNYPKYPVQRDTLLRSLKIDPKHPVQRDTLLRSLNVAQHDTKALKTDPKAQNKAQKPALDFAALHKKFQIGSKKDREEVIKIYREHMAAVLKAKKTSSELSLRPKRDIAATVVGAAVSSVVANLMKNVASHEIPNVVPVKQDVQEPQGMILGSGEAPVSNEIVPRPFFPVRVPVSNDVVPAPVAPIHADVEVVVGGNVTSTSTAAPAAVEKGFWATFFSSIKLFFGTVTNSVGGFFINIGQTLSDFVEKRVNVR